MKVTLRFTLLSVLVGLLLLTVTVLGYSSYENARFTADDLSQQIVDQTSSGVDNQIKDLLSVANTQGDLNRRLLESGQQDPTSFPRLAAYWVEVMKAQPRLTRVSLGLEASGEWLYVRRRPDGRLAIGELRQVPRSDRLALRDFWPEAYPHGQPFYFNPDKTDEDPRPRPWYVAGKRAKKQTWSESYVFFGTEGVADVPGVSCATPVFRDEKLVGVLTSSFDLGEVCRFLKALKVGKNGYAFVVEYKSGSGPVVIAHPRPETLMRDVNRPGKERIQELVPAAESSDPLVPVFLGHLPPDFAPDQVKDQGVQSLHFIHEGVHYLGAYRRLSTDNPNWLVCVVLPEAEVLGRVDQSKPPLARHRNRSRGPRFAHQYLRFGSGRPAAAATRQGDGGDQSIPRRSPPRGSFAGVRGGSPGRRDGGHENQPAVVPEVRPGRSGAPPAIRGAGGQAGRRIQDRHHLLL